MAANSKRELAIARIVSKLEELTSLFFVDRKPITGISDLQAYAQTQLPMAAVMGRMPVPVTKKSDQRRALDKVISVLGIDVVVYALDNVTPDTTISSLADDIWVKLYDDITQGYKWIIDTEITPEANIAVWDPYVAFSMLVNITYIHDKGGI